MGCYKDIALLILIAAIVQSQVIKPLKEGCNLVESPQFPQLPNSRYEETVAVPQNYLVTITGDAELFLQAQNRYTVDKNGLSGISYLRCYDAKWVLLDSKSYIGGAKIRIPASNCVYIIFGFDGNGGSNYGYQGVGRYRYTFRVHRNEDCGWFQAARISNGESVMPREYPSAVALKNRNGRHPFCGGTIISHRHVLTAEHCMTTINNVRDVMVIAGTTTPLLSNPGDSNVYGVLKTYKRDSFDIALLLIDRDISFDQQIYAACLPWPQIFQGNPEFDYEQVTVVGWGTKSFGGAISADLLKTQVVVTPNTFCQQEVDKIYNNELIIKREEICTVDPKAKFSGSCQFDSGGQVILTRNNRQHVIGIISHGPGCTYNNISIGVNTRVSSFVNWIAEVKDVSYCPI